MDKGTNATAHVEAPLLPQALFLGIWSVHAENVALIPLSGTFPLSAGLPGSGWNTLWLSTSTAKSKWGQSLRVTASPALPGMTPLILKGQLQGLGHMYCHLARGEHTAGLHHTHLEDKGMAGAQLPPQGTQSSLPRFTRSAVC